MKIFTVGHSTRSWPEFLQLLQKYAISLVIDVRAFPSSQRFPHFNREYLARELFGAGISYWWLGRELGGYRRREEGLGENSLLPRPLTRLFRLLRVKPPPCFVPRDCTSVVTAN